MVQPFNADDSLDENSASQPSTTQNDSSDDQLMEDLQAIEDARERKSRKQRSPVSSVSSTGSSEDSGVGSFHKKLDALANTKFGKFISKKSKKEKPSTTTASTTEANSGKICMKTMVQPFTSEESEPEDDGIEVLSDSAVEYTPVPRHQFHGTKKPERHVDEYDLERNHPILNEEYIRFGIAKENLKEYEVLKFMLKNERKSDRENRKRYAEKMMLMQRQKIRIEHMRELQRTPPVAAVMGETMEEYIHHLRENSLVESKTRPSIVPDPRVRRRIEEGSYPNWSVKEDELPTLLR